MNDKVKKMRNRLKAKIDCSYVYVCAFINYIYILS